MTLLSQASRTEIVAAYVAGESSGVVAERFGVRPEYVRVLYQRSPRKGARPASRHGGVALAPIPAEVRDLYRRAAEKRGVSVKNLVHNVLVQSASLIDAILDDAA